MIEVHDNGGITIDGEHIEVYRMLTLRRGLMLEVQTGMKLSHGRSCYAIIKSEFGLKGNKENVLRQFEAMLTNAGIINAE